MVGTLRRIFVGIQWMFFIRDVHLIVHVVSSSAIAILGTLSLVQRFDVCSPSNNITIEVKTWPGENNPQRSDRRRDQNPATTIITFWNGFLYYQIHSYEQQSHKLKPQAPRIFE